MEKEGGIWGGNLQREIAWPPKFYSSYPLNIQGSSPSATSTTTYPHPAFFFFSPDFRKITLPAGERRKGPLSHPKFWGPCSWVYREQNTCQMGIWSPWLVTCIWARENTFLASFVDCWRGFLSNLFGSRTFISHSTFTVYPGTVCWTAATYISCLLQPHSGS